jgi:Flp pilus assembly protein TadG
MRHFLRRFRKDKKGLAAVEFALILPVMITLFFGVVEMSMALSCRANVANTASTVSDLIAQDTEVSSNDITNVFNAATAILYPYSATPVKITVTSIKYDTVSKSLTSGKVAWSDTKNGTARTVNDTVSVPDGLMTANGSVIMTEVTYAYASPTTKVITGTVNMTNTYYTKPRRVAAINRVS